MISLHLVQNMPIVKTYVYICAHCLKSHARLHIVGHAIVWTHPCVFFARASVSTDVSLNHSWMFKQWHHCMCYQVPWSSDACLCVFFVCACANVFVRCSIKKSHCVTAAHLLPSCFRGEGKTGRIRGGMSISRGRAPLKLHTSMKRNGSAKCMLLGLGWNAEISRCWEKKKARCICRECLWQ